MIKTLFTTIDQIQDYLTVDISSNSKTILPYMKQAEKYTTEIIGKALHADLLEVVHGTNDEEKLKDLLEVVRLPLANFGYFLAIDKLNVNVGEKGFTVSNNQNLAPASQWRVDNFRESVKQSGYDGIEDLIEFLEDNAKHYPKWTQSKAYSFNKQFFVNNANEFDQAIKTEISRVKFLELKPYIHQVERAEIIKSISTGLFRQLKEQIKANNLTTDNKYLLEEYIRPAICYMAASRMKEGFKDIQFLEGEASRYIEEMRNFLNENADKYTEYKLSDCYEDPTIEVEEINNEDSGLFVGGSF